MTCRELRLLLTCTKIFLERKKIFLKKKNHSQNMETGVIERAPIKELKDLLEFFQSLTCDLLGVI